MGQLIKLQDYVSRYEQDIYRYPSRFVRLKRQQWERYALEWEQKDQIPQEDDELDEFWLEDKQSLFTRFKGMLKFGSKNEIIVEVENEKEENDSEEQDPAFQFDTKAPMYVENIDELKHHFLDHLLRFQMKWASSTLTEKSYIDQSYIYDERLRFFIQRFPDTYLILYKPIFKIKNAPVEGEIILITPTEAICLTFLEEEDNAVFIGGKEHFWVKRYKDEEKKVLNPLVAVNRTEKIVKQIFKLYEIELPIKKVVMCRNGYIDYPLAPYDVQLLEKRSFEKWFQAARNLRSPIKLMQLKGAQALLQYCQTSSVRRLEWDQS